MKIIRHTKAAVLEIKAQQGKTEEFNRMVSSLIKLKKANQ